MTENTSTITEQLQATREERKAQHSEAAARWEEISRWYKSFPTVEQIREFNPFRSSNEEPGQ